MKSTTEPARSQPDFVHTEISGNVLHVAITRAQKRNALNDATILALGEIFATIPAEVRAVILHGGGDHFSAGLDLSELRERDAMEGVLHSRMWHRVIETIKFAAVPVIAVLRGAVVGGGLELACAAHLRVAEPTTFYALPEGQRGIFVGGGASVHLTQLIGVARMTDMMLTGRVYQAEEGATIGISHYLVGAGEGMSKALELAGKIANNAPATNFALLQVLPRIAEMSADQGLLMEALIASIAQSTPEAKARIQQFLDKKAKKVGEA